MSYGPLVPFFATMASAGTLTPAVDLQRSWKNVFLEIPTMTSNTQHYIQGSSSNTTYRRIYHPQQNSPAPVGAAFIVDSAVTNALIPIPAGIRYLKIETTATVNDGAVYRIICSD